MMLHRTLLGLVLTSLSVTAMATQPAEPNTADTPVINAETSDQLQATFAEIRAEMRSGGRYGALTRRQRERVNVGVNDMSRMLAEHGSVADMPERVRVRLFNTQEEVNALLTGSGEDKLVCRMVQKVGSNMRQRECRRASEMRATREDHRDAYRDIRPTQGIADRS